MKKKTIKKLARSSYTNKTLDGTKVNRIVKYLTRGGLKVYIKDLKKIEMQKIVTVTIPNEHGITEIKDYFKKIYPSKKIVVKINQDLINGVRVEEYDNEYEFSLKSLMSGAIKSTND